MVQYQQRNESAAEKEVPSAFELRRETTSVEKIVVFLIMYMDEILLGTRF